ncbi:SPOR domain-containing protein [Sediminitomix flava]|uniref:Ezrin/radixin/moesin family protein n=1 Tax=Sediminitomix flava TaxID=379075 RepID=A0A315ZIL0_SEDFL|nr:SPOR domain-containing protein [Sediminitomix flava]PWJ44658.1 hypothetical protein BC781_1011029 [Sediminitomix flava]
MKHILIVLTLFVGVAFTSTTAYSQSKKEKKAEIKKWKKKLKSMDPLKLRDMTEELNSLKGQVSGLKSEISNLEKKNSQLETQVKSKDSDLSDLRAKLAKAQDEAKASVSAGDNWDTGIVYKVQVGAFRNKNLSKYQDQGSFWVEDKDGVKKYTIANFRDYEEADAFKKYMREMGVKDAWIVAYEDNIRKDIKDVLKTTKAKDKQRERR